MSVERIVVNGHELTAFDLPPEPSETYAPAHVAELQAENAKLRELLTDLAVCACGKYCYGCPHQYDGCDRDERLRELIGGEDA